jgi:UDP-N-acetylmuramoylalanine--D-glutamate ligase
MIVAVTGTRGKSMTTTLIYEILKQNEKFLKINVYVGGNLRGVATLPLLKKVKDGDILVCELDSWQLQGFGEAKISPHISVFTTFMPDHMNYYRGSMEKYFEDKAQIFRNQKKDDILVILSKMKKFINTKNIPGKLYVAVGKTISDWKFNVPGEHQRDNLSCAVKVAELLEIPESKIKKSVVRFKALEGRLQLLKIYNGVKIYNDNNATTPEATIAGMEAMKTIVKDKSKRRIVLICGGADKKLNLTTFVKAVNNNCKAVSLIPGTGTDVLLAGYKLKVNYTVGKDFQEVVKIALNIAHKGDIILFSPAFASFGMFNNEYERNDLFMKIIKKLK